MGRTAAFPELAAEASGAGEAGAAAPSRLPAVAAGLLLATFLAAPATLSAQARPATEARAAGAKARAPVSAALTAGTKARAPEVRGPEAAAPAAAQDTVRAYDSFVRPSPEVLRARRARLLDSLGVGVALVPSGSPMDIESDYPQASDFRQDNDFLYLTGLETPDSWLLVAGTAAGGRREVLFVPERDPSEERWTGPRPGPQEAARISGVEEVRTAAEFERMTESGSLVPPQLPLHVPLDRRTLSSERIRRIVAGASGRVRDLEPVLAQLRLVKDDFELKMLRRAVGITDEALRTAMRRAAPGQYEYQLEAVIEYGFRRRGAERVGFPSIVGSGPNSVVLHYDESRRKMDGDDLVVMDVGAEYSYYTADVTRTIPVSGRFTDRQRKLYRLVLGAQRAGIRAVRPGNTVSDVSRAARSYLREHSDGLCGEESCVAHFVHGVGHWLGMDVHDVGDYATPFQPGMVLTVEPGVYLAEEELGIRIEDDVLVTESGREVLSTAPKEPEAIEALMAEGG